MLIDPQHRSFPAYDLPLIALAARVLGAARVTGMTLSGRGRRASLDRRTRTGCAVRSRPPRACGRRHPRIRRSSMRNSAGPRATGTDPALWQRAVDAARDGVAPAQLAPYAAFRLAEALANAGDRAGARAAAQTAREWAEAIGMGLIVDCVTELERRVGAVGGDHRDVTGGCRIARGASHRARAPGARSRRARAEQRPDRRAALHQHQDRQRARVEHPSQDGCDDPHRSGLPVGQLGALTPPRSPQTRHRASLER